MRIVNLMTLVFAMLLLAIIPTMLQFGRMAGANQSASLATVTAVGCLVVLARRQP